MNNNLTKVRFRSVSVNVRVKGSIYLLVSGILSCSRRDHTFHQIFQGEGRDWRRGGSKLGSVAVGKRVRGVRRTDEGRMGLSEVMAEMMCLVCAKCEGLVVTPPFLVISTQSEFR
jgi:hypothetical protein